MECQELVVDAQTDDDSLPENNYIREWCANQESAVKKAGLTQKTSGGLLKKQMTEAGFENVVVREFKLPVGPWPTDARLNQVGRFPARRYAGWRPWIDRSALDPVLRLEGTRSRGISNTSEERV